MSKLTDALGLIDQALATPLTAHALRTQVEQARDILRTVEEDVIDAELEPLEVEAESRQLYLRIGNGPLEVTVTIDDPSEDVMHDAVAMVDTYLRGYLGLGNTKEPAF